MSLAKESFASSQDHIGICEEITLRALLFLPTMHAICGITRPTTTEATIDNGERILNQFLESRYSM